MHKLEQALLKYLELKNAHVQNIAQHIITIPDAEDKFVTMKAFFKHCCYADKKCENLFKFVMEQNAKIAFMDRECILEMIAQGLDIRTKLSVQIDDDLFKTMRVVNLVMTGLEKNELWLEEIDKVALPRELYEVATANIRKLLEKVEDNHLIFLKYDDIGRDSFTDYLRDHVLTQTSIKFTFANILRKVGFDEDVIDVEASNLVEEGYISQKIISRVFFHKAEYEEFLHLIEQMQTEAINPLHRELGQKYFSDLTNLASNSLAVHAMLEHSYSEMELETAQLQISLLKSQLENLQHVLLGAHERSSSITHPDMFGDLHLD